MLGDAREAGVEDLAVLVAGVPHQLGSVGGERNARGTAVFAVAAAVDVAVVLERAYGHRRHVGADVEEGADVLELHAAVVVTQGAQDAGFVGREAQHAVEFGHLAHEVADALDGEHARDVGDDLVLRLIELKGFGDARRDMLEAFCLCVEEDARGRRQQQRAQLRQALRAGTGDVFLVGLAHRGDEAGRDLDALAGAGDEDVAAVCIVVRA